MFVLGFKVYFLLTMHIHYDWFHNLLSDTVVKFMLNDWGVITPHHRLCNVWFE